MRRWLIAGAALAVVTTLVVLLIVERHAPPDPLIADFHTVERQCLATFTDALHRQGANQIDELMLAQIVERDVLPPWHAFRLRVEAAPDSPLVLAMRRYFEDRETAWQAYVVTLRAPADAPAALETYRKKNAEANADAQALAKLLPRSSR
jgi:hypothetical protein